MLFNSCFDEFQSVSLISLLEVHCSNGRTQSWSLHSVDFETVLKPPVCFKRAILISCRFFYRYLFITPFVMSNRLYMYMFETLLKSLKSYEFFMNL